jgi:transposase
MTTRAIIKERRDQVRALLGQGLRPKAIAQQLGVDSKTVSNDLRFLGLVEQSKQQTARSREEMRKAIPALSPREAANKFGVTESHVMELRKAMGVPRERLIRQMERRRQVRVLLDEGYTSVQAAKALGVHYTTIYHDAKALGRG